ncbi:MAG TPA: hypothetical protein VFZ74_02840 [Burkholderiales bacterium]
MNTIDRTVIPSLHAAARRHRALYVSCLFRMLIGRRAAPCA